MNTCPWLVLLTAFAASSSAMAALPLPADTASATDNAAPVGPGAKGTAVLRAQVLLDRAHFSSGEIDATYGSNLRKAIEGYQKASGLKVTGTLEAPTWGALNADTAPILISYTVQDSDVAGPFAAIPPEMADKAKMTTLGYVSVEEALGEKFHMSPALLSQLNPGKDLGRAGEEIVVANTAVGSIWPKAAKVIIDDSDGTLTLVDASGKTLAQFPATTGSEHDPLPLGNWKVRGVARNPVFKYNPQLFWDADASDIKATLPAGPNNPVGIVWVDLTKAHYGIHGTPEPSHVGKTESHGCIRLTNWDAAALAQSVVPGVDVVLQE